MVTGTSRSGQLGDVEQGAGVMGRMSEQDVGSTVVEPGSVGDRAARVFEFLVELQRLRTRVVRSVDTYRSVSWFEDIPDAPGVVTSKDADDGTWLSVDRVERDAPPIPPKELRAWITDKALRDSTQLQPALSERIVRVIEVLTEDGAHERATEELLLQECPAVLEALTGWVSEWQAWAREDRPRAAVAELYHRLYAMYQDSRALAETYEVVLGFGLLTTRSGGQDVRRHLVTAAVTIELDLDSGRLVVLPSPDAGPLSLEQDMLAPEDTVPDDVRQVIREMLEELGDPWAPDPAGVSGVLRTWVNGSGAQAAYLADLAPANAATPAAGSTVVTFAPALMLRERTRRSFIAACEQIIVALRAGAPVPTGVRQFVEITDGRVPDAEQVRWQQSYTDEEVYFPKPANEAQRQIVERLANHQTVVVQGPPGTGKTHTIANLISDLLGHGQRVLITSTTTRALKVLKEKLPREISDLCVSVTDDAVKGQADLERSVSTILSQADLWNADVADREAASLRENLAAVRAVSAQAAAELRSIREQETYVYAPEIGDYQGTLQSIAEQVATDEATHGWLGPVPTEHPIITGADAQRYLHLLRTATPAVRKIARPVPDAGALPTPEDFETLAGRRVELIDKGQSLAGATQSEEFQALAPEDPAHREQLRLALLDLKRQTDELRRRREPWVADALADVHGGRDRAWRQRYESTMSAVQTVQTLLPILDSHVVSGLTDIEPGVAIAHAENLIEHLNAGGKLKGVFGRTKPAKTASLFLDACQVDGRPCQDINQLQVAQAQAQTDRALLPVERLWGYDDQQQAPTTHRLATLQDEAQVLGSVLWFSDALTVLDQRIRAIVALPAVDLSSAADVHRLQQAIDALALATVQVQIQTKIEPALRVLKVMAQQPQALPGVVRAAAAVRDWDTGAYVEAYTQMAAARDANALLASMAESAAVIRSALPSLADNLEATPDDPEWDSRLQGLVQAWAWSAWEARLQAKTAPWAENHWRHVLADAEVDQRTTLQELATNRGWSHCLSRLTPTESTHLKMYAHAIRKVGKGTGKYAARYRADARVSLRACQTAVPAWIMPMHQVFETVPVDRPNLFDVIIVDEASQSGLEGLLLSWLAPRMVVVGDDKQVSPSNVGLDHEGVFTLQDRYLNSLEHKSLFGPMSSFFDQAVGMSTTRIMLREHFRCMPEIIGFSNELCYRGDLIPLRQYGADRLPPLRTTYLKGAMVAGRSPNVVNEAEVDAIVDQIQKCCADPQYDGRTMGVITMLGNTQDKLMTQRLVEALGVRVVEERGLRAGNAEAFQGDERDVIFVSMVSSLQSTTGPARIGPLSKESDQQRLNVAASRARDQVWLFHSVHPGDLSAKDLRQRYLQYLLKPVAEQDALDIGEVLPDERHPGFDSLFEQRVFLAIRARGYRVRPQLKVGSYRIDLVVEGGTQRLAVECDGDAFHSGAAQADDDARQRDLERVGWTFWRVRGSAFYRDPDKALEALWTQLEKLHIQPDWGQVGPDDAVHTEVEATAVAAGADVILEELQLPTAHGVAASPALMPVIEIRETAHADPAIDPGPATLLPRFRAGKMVLTPTARNRVEREADAITAWLNDPPPVKGVDARSLEVQRNKQENHREDLETRLSLLKRILAQSVADPQHAGGQWVTPGCVVGLRFAGATSIERVVVSSMPVAEHEELSPFTELGQAVEGVELGAKVQYESPRGLVEVVVEEIQN
jgi:very-short-patch-repair endonuclease/transcription elongation GreA/GreB family factor/DNA polymerase III delta prime subunit